MDRQASDKERAKDLPTLKDNDFLNDGIAVHVDPEQKEKIISTLESDSSVGFISSAPSFHTFQNKIFIVFLPS